MMNEKNKELNGKLVLGTAQLGMCYGIANKTGQPNEQQAADIVRTAWDCGIREFDTAQGYGNSEQVLGKALAKLGIAAKAKIISKIDPKLDHLSKYAMTKALDKTLERLGVESISGLILHRESFLEIWDHGLFDVLKSFQEAGKVERLGVSVYSTQKAAMALEMDSIDLIQLPSNVIDRRFENMGFFSKADQKGKTIYLRSIFLQGLLLMDPAQLSQEMGFARPVLEELVKFCTDHHADQQQVALSYLKTNMPNAHVVFGAETAAQVKENARLWNSDFEKDFFDPLRKNFSSVNEQILNPALWPQGTK